MVITFENVSLRFPGEKEPLLHSVSFHIQRGETVVITGASGSGKSSLLYLMNKLYPHNIDAEMKGNIYFFNRCSTSYAPGEVNRHIGTIFQNPDTQFCMPTITEEFAFTLETNNFSRAAMNKKIPSALKTFQLAQLKDAVIQTLSGGTKQRVAASCALIYEPQVLLLDEPLSHLDPFTAQQFVRWLRDIQEKQQLTIVVIEHQLTLWGDFFDRRLHVENQTVCEKTFPTFHRVPLHAKQRVEHLPVALSCKHWTVNKGQTTIVQDAQFQLRFGAITSLLGPNGAGKSILFESFIEHQQKDTLHVDGTIGFIPQSPEHAFLAQTVLEELLLFHENEEERALTILTNLHLLHTKDQHPYELSHGEKRRLAIGIAQMTGARILLFDEPTSGQDPHRRQMIQQLLLDLANDGYAIGVITHDTTFSAQISDDYWLIREGRTQGPFRDTLWANEHLLNTYHLLPPNLLEEERLR